MPVLDEKDSMILDLLQEDCRMSLTDIAKAVELSVDAVNKRIKKLLGNNVFYPKIQLRPWNFGFTIVMEAKIRLHNHTAQDMEAFVEHLLQHVRVTEMFSISGEWDFSIVIIAKDASDFANVTDKIRTKFSRIIQSWSESMTTKCHKFEEYNMKELLRNE